MAQLEKLYFAYGSNMLTERLLCRCPSAMVVALARADGYSLEFRKESKDGSGKATLVEDAGKRAYGVLFKFNKLSDWGKLDQAEGACGPNAGYKRCESFLVRRVDTEAEI